MESEQKIFEVKISELKNNSGLSENLNEEDVQRIVESISEFGIIMPILLDKDYNVIAGRHRIEASIRCNKETIKAIFVETEDRHEIEIIENTFHRSLSIKEKINYATYLEKKYKAARGRPAKDSENNLSPTRKINSSLEMVLKYGVFRSKDEYYRAKNIIAKGVPNLINSVDNGFYSLTVASQVADLEPEEQEKRIISDENSLGRSKEDASDNAKKRRKLNRKVKKQEPIDPQADPIHSIVRIAPNFWDELFDDIAETPIHNYINPTCGIVAIECTNQFIHQAIHLLDYWNLHYKATITVYTKKAPEATHMDYINRETTHLVIGRVDPDLDCGFDWVDPVLDRQDHAEAVNEIIAKIWPTTEDPRIDMTSIEPREGWAVWKIDYAKQPVPSNKSELDGFDDPDLMDFASWKQTSKNNSDE